MAMQPPSPPVPRELSGPLRFGDPLQIRALRSHQAELDAREKLKRYKVHISVFDEVDIEVWAENPEAAEEAAWEAHNVGDWRAEYKVIEIDNN